MQQSWFERNPKLTLTLVSLILIVASMGAIESMAKWLGLGKVVVYESSPVYGYRPIPNQDASRKAAVPLKFNNLGFRAEQDWEPNDSANKVLFLGDSVTYGGSYIANHQLFSHRALADFPNWQSANAGVNAWGVLNVYALIKQMEFLPADIYVSLFPEGDFYRGLMRIGGQPFWTAQPRFALQELWQYWVFKNHIKKTYAHPKTPFSEKSTQQAIDIAANALKDLDNYLKSHGKKHIIYISPSMQQLNDGAPIDEKVQAALKKYNVEVVYLRDKIANLGVNNHAELFHDNIHLSEKGHQLWATLIANDLKTVMKS